MSHSSSPADAVPTDTPAVSSIVIPPATPASVPEGEHLEMLQALERKILWLASWTIHNANHLRPSTDGLKVGGHQASSASINTIMTALYLHVLRPEDRVAVKPHASPVFHAIQYLFGRQTRDNLINFRAMGGAQSYPSRTKDDDDVDFSTGSVGLGVAMTSFASIVQDYLVARDALPRGVKPGRMIALVGDAELDEGNVYEALLEGWKQDIRNVWWVIDYNRQSLDSVVNDRLYRRFDRLFENMGWRVVTIKYGKRLEAVFKRPGGEALRNWIDDCPNVRYSTLTFKGGEAWRVALLEELGDVAGITDILADHDDEALGLLMTNLGGHDMETMLEAYASVTDDQPTCFIAYTIKGHGLPFAGHKDNHAGLMSPEEIDVLRAQMKVPEGQEWEPFVGLDYSRDEIDAFLKTVPFSDNAPRRHRAPRIETPKRLPVPQGAKLSTQEAFGRVLTAIARDDSDLARHIVTTSPDVTVSTNLGGWVNRRKIYGRASHDDGFDAAKIKSFQQWNEAPDGQHIELGIAENNLFINLAALGLSHALYGVRLLPIGTVYDPFIERGLDALNYACYQDARFMLVATPSGISLAPEGGAHQSIATPVIGMAQDGLAYFDPTYADELAVIMSWGFDYMQREGGTVSGDLLKESDGGSVYLRLSSRPVDQPDREIDDTLASDIIAGGYWIRTPASGARVVIAYTGAVGPEAAAGFEAVLEDFPDAGLLAVTSADRLHAGWNAAMARRQTGGTNTRSHIENLLSVLAPDARIVTVVDGHPTTLSWLGSVTGNRVYPLGVDHFGQSANLHDLYAEHRIDANAIVDACAAACLGR